MKYRLISKARASDGEEIKLKINGCIIKIKFSYHSIFRVFEWGIKADKIICTLLFPDEVLEGYNKRFIAHKVYGEHIVRAVYEYKESTPYLVTVYYPYKKRYFKGGGKFADKIFPGS